jgi:hypothetical protein
MPDMSQQRLSKWSEGIINAWNEAQHCVLPVILTEKVSPTIAAFLVIKHGQEHMIGSDEMTEEQIRLAARAFLNAWSAGLFVPVKDYPYTLEQTIYYALRERTS